MLHNFRSQRGPPRMMDELDGPRRPHVLHLLFHSLRRQASRHLGPAMLSLDQAIDNSRPRIGIHVSLTIVFCEGVKAWYERSERCKVRRRPECSLATCVIIGIHPHGNPIELWHPALLFDLSLLVAQSAGWPRNPCNRWQPRPVDEPL